MKLGTFVVAGMCGMVGLVAGRVSAPGATNVVAAAPPPRVVSPTVVAVVPTQVVDEPAAEPEDDGLDLANVLASAKQQAAELARTHEAIRGHVTDPSGQGLPGVTVIAAASTANAMTAVTDEHGDYEILGLPSASYLVTFYYADQTIERTGIATREVEPTQLDLSLDPNAHPSYGNDFVVNLPAQGRTFDVEIEQDSEYANIPIPGRTFDAVLGAATGSQDDNIGISFSGGTSLENTYIIVQD